MYIYCIYCICKYCIYVCFSPLPSNGHVQLPTNCVLSKGFHMRLVYSSLQQWVDSTSDSSQIQSLWERRLEFRTDESVHSSTTKRVISHSRFNILLKSEVTCWVWDLLRSVSELTSRWASSSLNRASASAFLDFTGAVII